MADNGSEMTFVFDLAIHTSVSGRSRAIDRYAAKYPPLAGSDGALILAAAQKASFAVWRVENWHETIGLQITDVVHEEQLWLIDKSLEASCPSGGMFASRLMTIDDFVITCGAIAPVDEFVLMEAWRSMPLSRSGPEVDDVQDPRFAAAMFRGAIHTGIMEDVRFIDPSDVDLQKAMRAG